MQLAIQQVFLYLQLIIGKEVQSINPKKHNNSKLIVLSIKFKLPHQKRNSQKWRNFQINLTIFRVYWKELIVLTGKKEYNLSKM
jgi:hypothetical protein